MTQRALNVLEAAARWHEAELIDLGHEPGSIAQRAQMQSHRAQIFLIREARTALAEAMRRCDPVEERQEPREWR